MYSESELMDLMLKANHGNYLSVGKKGNRIWNRFRGFEFIIYPEHFDGIQDLIEKLKASKIPCCLSPLHDKDLKDDGISYKKAHYHLIFFYEGKTTLYRCYSDFCNFLGEDSFASVEVVGSMVGAVEYQAHIDNDDKAKYSLDEILGFNGFNVNKYLLKGLGDDIMGLKSTIKKIILENNILFFDELDDYLELNDLVTGECLARNRDLSRWVKDYLKSREHRLWYAGGVEKGYTKVHMDNGTDKVIFTREIVGA